MAGNTYSRTNGDTWSYCHAVKHLREAYIFLRAAVKFLREACTFSAFRVKHFRIRQTQY